jgi:cell division protein FtsN
MPKNETGEFELVLGNRQLLSGFAVVAILFGVFFAMGYIVGRNSTPSARLMTPEMQSQAAPAAANTSAQPDPGRAQTTQPAQPATAADTAAPANPAAGGEAATQATGTQPAAAPPQPATQAARTAEPPKPAERPAESMASVPVTDVLQAGTYLQVMAIKRVDAEVIVKALQGKGFPTCMTPSSIEGIFRVMVGPYKDATALGNAKTQLENSGFHPIVQKIAERG